MARRRYLSSCAILASLALSNACGIGAAAQSPRLVVGPPVASHGFEVYRVAVLEDDVSAVAILPAGTRLASLEIDGVVVRRVAHRGAALLLADLRPGERVVLRLFGSHEMPRIIDERDIRTGTFGVGLVTAIVCALLAAAVLLQVAAIVGNRHWAAFWFVARRS